MLHLTVFMWMRSEAWLVIILQSEELYFVVKMLCVKLGDSFVSLYMYVLILLSVVITFDYHIYGLCSAVSTVF